MKFIEGKDLIQQNKSEKPQFIYIIVKMI